MSSSLTLHSEREENINRSIRHDTSKLSQSYQTPVVTTVEETKSDSQRSSKCEEFKEISIKNFTTLDNHVQRTNITTQLLIIVTRHLIG